MPSTAGASNFVCQTALGQVGLAIGDHANLIDQAAIEDVGHKASADALNAVRRAGQVSRGRQADHDPARTRMTEGGGVAQRRGVHVRIPAERGSAQGRIGPRCGAPGASVDRNASGRKSGDQTARRPARSPVSARSTL